MAQRLKQSKIIEKIFLISIVIIFLLLANRYIISDLKPGVAFGKLMDGVNEKISQLDKERDITCPEGQIKITVEGGDLCRDNLLISASAGQAAYFLNTLISQGLSIGALDLEKIPLGLDYLSGSDTDGDGLPDSLEDAIGTDKINQDSDSDGYKDMEELANGYNPRGEAALNYDLSLVETYKGLVLVPLQHGDEAWFINPINNKKYFLGEAKDMFKSLIEQGTGITTDNLEKIPIGLDNLSGADTDEDGLPDILEDIIGTNKNNQDSDGDGYGDMDELANNYNPNGIGALEHDNKFANRERGKILLSVGVGAEIWYVNPGFGKRYFLGKAADDLSLDLKFNIAFAEDDADIDYDEDIYLKIFDTYPKSGKGKEIVYDFLDEGEIEIADSYLDNNIHIERYESIIINKINWDEDPYGDKYWRFLYYSLRETRHLLYAYRETSNTEYADKLEEIIGSFVSDGISKPLPWDDYHAVSFRAMVLTNTWWKLRENNHLSLDLNQKILKALKKHGDFLLDEEHYQGKYNHGLNQSTALLLLGVNFPDIDKNGEWKKTGIQRVNDGIKSLIDNDGALIENSPFYHFYVLEKYWGLKKYFQNNSIPLEDFYTDKLDKMVAYAGYILKPDLNVPLLGASIKRAIGNQGVFREIANEYPEFKYVITQGREGNKPGELNKFYKNTGQAILRSGWEEKTKFENNFEAQTQIIFDIGPYRTDHSDKDALNFNLFSKGEDLIIDTGLYTYEETDELRQYFHGTKGHNTIVVDGQDQRMGAPMLGVFKEGEGYAYATAQHDLYPQTYHQRGMILIGDDLIVIIDRLISNNKHNYEQLFHLAPGLNAELDGSTVVVKNEVGENKLTLRQILDDGLIAELGDIENDPNNNLCSFEYGKKIACQMVSFKKYSKNLNLFTLIEIGEKNNNIIIERQDNNTIKVIKGSKEYLINLNPMDENFFEKIKTRERLTGEYKLDLFFGNNKWQLAGDGSDLFEILTGENKNIILAPKSIDENPEYNKRPFYKLTIDGLDEYYSKDQKIYLDIPDNYKEKNFRIYEQEDFLPILGYHHVIQDEEEITSPTLQIRLSDFDKQIDYMTREVGCRWFTFGDIMENYVLKEEKTPKRACVINFDDGRKNHITNGYPILKKYGAIASYYIITERAYGYKESYMDLFDLDELFRDGNEIGSHTVGAGSLLTDGYDETGLIYQLDESKAMLNSQNYKVKTFAYPRGEQNPHIVEIAKNYYIAGRDTAKDNKWRDPRPLTVSFKDDFAWHMHYYKPELVTPEEMGAAIAYNSFWQFEEDYRVDINKDGSIKDLPSNSPSEESFATVDLKEAGNKISNKFIVSRDSEYTIELYATVNDLDQYRYPDSDPISVFIDNEKHSIYQNINDECKIYNNQYYCYYNVDTRLSAGVHVISLMANLNNIKLDKFKIYRELNTRNIYSLSISKKEKVFPEANPENLKIELEINSSYKFLFPIIPAGIIMSIFIYSKKRKRRA